MNSPVGLGVSPAAASTPTGVFHQRFEALCPRAGALGCVVCFALPLFLPVYLWANVGLGGLLVVVLPAPFVPQSTTSLGSASCRLVASPLCPSCPSPPFLLVWMNVSSLSPWLSDFHAVRFSQFWLFLFLNCCCPSFGCTRRCSVSTYASILAGSLVLAFKIS